VLRISNEEYNELPVAPGSTHEGLADDVDGIIECDSAAGTTSDLNDENDIGCDNHGGGSSPSLDGGGQRMRAPVTLHAASKEDKMVALQFMLAAVNKKVEELARVGPNVYALEDVLQEAERLRSSLDKAMVVSSTATLDPGKGDTGPRHRKMWERRGKLCILDGNTV
jgi:hypothetical protein